METHSSFFEFVRVHRARLPRLSRLLDGLDQARREASITDRPFDLFLARNPDYWPRQADSLARELDQVREIYEGYRIDKLQDEIHDAHLLITKLLAEDWSLGKGYRIVALRSHIARLNEFLFLKKHAVAWPMSWDLYPAGVENRDREEK